MADRTLVDEQVSLFAIGTALLRNRLRIALWAVAGAVLAMAMVITKPKLYPATLAFVPQSSDPPSRAGLAALAGQLGIYAPGGNPSQQPEFYTALIQSREILGPIVLDTVEVQEENSRRVALIDLFKVRGGSPANRTENGIKKLRGRMSVGVVKAAGIVRVVVRSEWPSVSLQVTQSVLKAVNDYNVRMRQSQAAAERRFVEARLADAKDSLRAAEDRLQGFLTVNRSGVESSPSLKSTWQRLEREVASKSTIFTALSQEYEEVRIREVRDTPTVTVFESPVASTIPEPRRRIVTTFLGLLLGAGVGVALALTRAAVARRRAVRDPDADEFFGALSESKSSLLRRLPVPRRPET